MNPFVVPLVYVDFAPTSEETQLVTSWATERGLRVRQAPAWSPPPLPVDLDAVSAIEEDLAEARDAILGLDLDLARSAQAHSDALLRAHVALPQAAFLRAEWHRVEAQRLRRESPSNDAAARAEAAAATTLDQGRVIAIGEESSEDRVTLRRTLETDAPVPDDAQLWLDGTLLASPAPGTYASTDVSILPGTHHMRLTVLGRTVGATWFEVPAGEVSARGIRTPIVVSWPKAPRCSAPTLQALVHAHALPQGATQKNGGEGCDDFFAVHRSVAATADLAPSSLRIARCNAFGCGAAQLLTKRAPTAVRPTRTNTWVPWVFVGLTTVATTAFALAAAGAFTPGKSPAPVFRNGGVRVEGASPAGLAP